MFSIRIPVLGLVFPSFVFVLLNLIGMFELGATRTLRKLFIARSDGYFPNVLREREI